MPRVRSDYHALPVLSLDNEFAAPFPASRFPQHGTRVHGLDVRHACHALRGFKAVSVLVFLVSLASQIAVAVGQASSASAAIRDDIIVHDLLLFINQVLQMCQLAVVSAVALPARQCNACDTTQSHAARPQAYPEGAATPSTAGRSLLQNGEALSEFLTQLRGCQKLRAQQAKRCRALVRMHPMLRSSMRLK